MTPILIATPDITGNIQTFLSQDYSSGTTLNVLSSVGFVSGNYTVVGEPGLENTEVINLTAIPSNVAFTIPALKFSHPKGTPVYTINWDKYELSYRTSSAGAWVVYPAMPANLAYDAQNAEYRDSAATSTYQWRYRYYSTEKTAYSDYSDVIGTTGWARNTVGYMVREIRKIINDPAGKTVNDTEIIRFLNAAQDKIYTLYDRWQFLFKTGTPILTLTGIKSYPLPTDFGRMHTVQFEYVFGGSDVTYNLRYLPVIEFDYETRDNTAANDDNIVEYSIYPGDTTSPKGYLYINPKPITAGLKITPRYFMTIPDLSTYADATVIPIPDIIENYALAQILKIRKEDDKANAYDAMFKEQVELLKLMQRKNASPMRSFWKYRGVKAEQKLFGTRDVYSDTTKEMYW
jgi:hypothetical protein